MRSEIIENTFDIWKQEPDKARGRPMVTARSEGSQAVLESGSFSWRADLPPALGGKNEAPSPTALLLGALAACAVALIRDTLAPQLRVDVQAVRATVQCLADARGLLGMEGATPALTDMSIAIEIESSEARGRVEALYAAWQQRCPIYLALIKPLSIATSLNIVST